MDRVLKINQAYSTTPWRRQTQIAVAIGIVLMVFLLISWVYLNVDARAAAIGRQIQRYYHDIDLLEKEIADKQSQLALLTSASAMETRAQELGFRQVSSDEILFLSIDGYTGRMAPAMASESQMAPAMAEPVMSPAFDQSLLDWVSTQLSLPPLIPERPAP